MHIRKRYYIITLIVLLLAGVAALCIVRWQAWFGMPEEPEWDGPVRGYVFPDFENDTTPQSFDMLVLGDIHNSLSTADYDTLAARVPQADVVAQTGDWMERGQGYYYQQLLQEWLPSHLCGLPVIATPGNHEYTKGPFKRCTETWLYAFFNPPNGPVGVPGASYYMDLPSIRFITIDTNPLWRTMYLTRTLTWLRTLMDSAGDRYVVVMMHHPVVSAGKGRFNILLYTTFHHALKQADLVIAGHDHSYMRRKPFIVLNTGGKPKAQRIGLHAQATDSVPVYGVISCQPSSLIFKAYRLNDGVLIDSLYVSHE